MTARKSASALLVPTTPTDPNHAASKSYVDSSISSATSGVNVAMDHVTGLVTALGGKMDKSVIDAKGEIVAGTAANTPGIVTAPSSDGQFLKSATAQATGMGWAALTSSDVGLGNVNNTSDAVKSVASAATLTTPRNIAGVAFDGSAAISLNQDNIGDATTNRSYTNVEKTKLAAITGTNTGDQTTITGNAGTATKLATARAINGVNFDGSAAITINAIDATAREPAITIGTSAQYWRGDKTMQTLNQDAVPDGTTNKAYTATDKTRLANTSGTNTGDQTSVTGNAGTATKLATARNINGTPFDGTADITVTASASPSIATTATAAGTTTLNSASATIQVFTGTQNQTVTLPTTSVLAGNQWMVVNQSTGVVTVNASGGATELVLAPGTTGVFEAVVNTPTTAANWDSQYGAVIVVSGKSLTVNNTLSLSGTDNTTMTFPASSGMVDAEQFCTLTSPYTLTSQTAAQKLFNASASGAVTLGIGTYFFDCFFMLSGMSATNGSFGFAIAPGTATISGQAWQTEANKAALVTAAASQNTVNTAANTALTTLTTNTVGWAHVWGKLRISAAGTVIPQVSLGFAAAAVVAADSYFRIWPVGSNTVTTFGTWS